MVENNYSNAIVKSMGNIFKIKKKVKDFRCSLTLGQRISKHQPTTEVPKHHINREKIECECNSIFHGWFSACSEVNERSPWLFKAKYKVEVNLISTRFLNWISCEIILIGRIPWKWKSLKPREMEPFHCWHELFLDYPLFLPQLVICTFRIVTLFPRFIWNLRFLQLFVRVQQKYPWGL